MKKQQPGSRFINFISTSIGIFYTSCLIYIFFFARRRWVPLPERIFNLVPFGNKVLYLQTYAAHTRPENVEFYKDLIGNIVLFIPFPLLLFYVIGIKSYSRLLWMSICASLFIEITQFTFNIGVADIDDVILNTIGSLIGLLILYLASGLKINYNTRSKWQAGKSYGATAGLK